MSSSQAGQASEPISIVENILANHLHSNPAHQGSTKLINAFKSQLNSNSPLANYRALRIPFATEGKKLEECILDPAYHNVIAHLMGQIGLDPTVIPLWAQTSSVRPSTPTSQPQAGPSVPISAPRRASKPSDTSASKQAKASRTAQAVDEQEAWRLDISRQINEKVRSLQDRFVVISEAHYDLETQHRSVNQQLQQRARELFDVQRARAQLEEDHRHLKEERDRLEVDNNQHRRAAIAAEEALVELKKKALGAMNSGNLEVELMLAESEANGARMVEVEKELEEERRLRREAEERAKRLEEEIEKLKSASASRVDASSQTIVVPPPPPPDPPLPLPTVPTVSVSTQTPNPTPIHRPPPSQTPIARANNLPASSLLGHKRPLSSTIDDHKSSTPITSTSEEPPVKKPIVKIALPPPRPPPLPPKRSSLGSTSHHPTSSTPKASTANLLSIPTIHEVGPRFGKGQPEESEERDAFQAFWASKVFPPEIHPESKICLACRLLNPSTPETLFPSPVAPKRLNTLKMNHYQNEHLRAWREITRGR